MEQRKMIRFWPLENGSLWFQDQNIHQLGDSNAHLIGESNMLCTLFIRDTYTMLEIKFQLQGSQRCTGDDLMSDA